MDEIEVHVDARDCTAVMNRRDALKTLAAGAGITITPVAVAEAAGAELVILRIRGKVSMDYRQQLAAAWRRAVRGTSLETVNVVVADEALDIEIVRR